MANPEAQGGEGLVGYPILSVLPDDLATGLREMQKIFLPRIVGEVERRRLNRAMERHFWKEAWHGGFW